MIKQSVLNTEGKKVGDIELAEEVFGAPVKKHLLYEVVKWQLACRRSGTANTKDRSDVAGSTAKIYRQKGTGRARHGQKRVNIFVGGATAFGPKTRSYEYQLPKKVRKSGLISALSLKVKEGKFTVVDSFEMKDIKTKKFVDIMGKLKVEKGLFVVNEDSNKFRLSARNVKNVKVLNCNHINVHDLLLYENAVFTAKAVEEVQKRLGQ